MKEAIRKSQIMEYAEKVLHPMLIDNLHIAEVLEDEEGTTDVWLLETDTGEEYWVLEGVFPTNIYKKSGIYTTPQRVFEAHKEMMQEELNKKEYPDRYSL